MRTIRIHFVSVAALTLLVFTAIGTAQSKPSGVLNALEVQQLVTRGEPADNARLATHFTALAERYSAEAKRHTSMSQNFVGNPNRNLGTAMSQHCKQLASLNTQSATTLRELANFHQKLASGATPRPLESGGKFQAGAGAPVPTDQELNAIAAKAGTPAEHRTIEEYLSTLAKRYTTEGNDHMTLAQTYRGTRMSQAATIHDRLATLARDEAKEATAGAEMHKQLAAGAK